MSIDKSLKKAGGLTRARNVLTRAERLALLQEDERWTPEQGRLQPAQDQVSPARPRPVGPEAARRADGLGPSCRVPTTDDVHPRPARSGVFLGPRQRARAGSIGGSVLISDGEGRSRGRSGRRRRGSRARADRPVAQDDVGVVVELLGQRGDLVDKLQGAAERWELPGADEHVAVPLPPLAAGILSRISGSLSLAMRVPLAVVGGQGRVRIDPKMIGRDPDSRYKVPVAVMR